MEIVWMVILACLIAECCAFLLAKRYEMSEKTDKGVELCYWKLSYRRKLIRTFWMLPLELLVINQFHQTFRNAIYTWGIGTLLLSLLGIQAVYNYRKWREESRK